ncbi:MAG: cytochrome c peroxidase, partial [Azonexus sp.]
MLRKSVLYLTALGLAFGLAWWVLYGHEDDRSTTVQALFGSKGAADIGFAALRPLGRQEGLDPAQVALGRQLFSDTRLSRDGSIACVSCHRFDKGGADGLPRSFGVGG